MTDEELELLIRFVEIISKKGDEKMKAAEIKLFDGVKNVEFTGMEYIEKIGAELPVFTLTDIPAEEWNRRARISNTKAFIELVGRQSVDYEEVLTWVYSLVEEGKERAIQAGTYMATV